MKNVLTGIFSPLFYNIAVNIGLYSGKYGIDLIMILSALHGIALIFLLIRDSLKEYFRSIGVCLLISCITILVYTFLGIDLAIHTMLTGYEEFSMGDGIIFAVALMCYLSSGLIGSVIAGVITFVRKRKAIRALENQ